MKKSTIFTSISVILLGSLGSGLWELAIRPVLNWGYSAALTISTLGIDSLRNGMYSAAASAGHTNIFALIAGMQLLMGSVFIAAGIIIRNIQISMRPNKDRLIAGYFIMFLLGGISLLVATSRTAYVAGLYGYNEKLETTVRPLVSEQELNELTSQYIQLSNREQYLTHVKKLHDILQSNGIKPPVRDFF